MSYTPLNFFIPQYYSQFDTVFIPYSVDIGDKCEKRWYYQ